MSDLLCIAITNPQCLIQDAVDIKVVPVMTHGIDKMLVVQYIGGILSCKIEGELSAEFSRENTGDYMIKMLASDIYIDRSITLPSAFFCTSVVG